MLTQSFLAGGATLLAAFILYRLWLGALPRTVCPECGDATLGAALRGAIREQASKRGFEFVPVKLEPKSSIPELFGQKPPKDPC